MEPGETRERLIESILSGERSRADGIIDEWALAAGYQKTIADILEPVLTEIGRMWAEERISFAAGYLAGKVIEGTLAKAIQCQEVIPRSKGPVVIGNVEDDFQSLGRKFVVIFLLAAGWEVIDLGNDVPASTFVDTAVQVGSKVIGVSAMMLSTAENIRAIREEIDKRALSGRIQLAVGGAIFKLHPELASLFGGDGTAAHAVDASSLFEKLWERASQNGHIG